MTPSPRVSVIIPVYNEVRTVATLMRRVRAVPLDLEIIAVNDRRLEGTATMPGQDRGAGALRTLWLLALLGAFSLAAPPPAHAYIDPLSGSIAFQVVVAAILGFVFTVKRWWVAVVRLTRRFVSRVMGR